MKTIFKIILIIGLYNVNVDTEKQNLKSNTNIENPNVKEFLRNPTNYTFICSATSDGEVLEANLNSKGVMIVIYKSIWDDGDHSGKLTGKFDKKQNRFSGRYKTNDNRFEGEINFEFNSKGEATGTWDSGFGTVKIRLKTKKNEK